MAACCDDKACAIEVLQQKQAGTLKTVLWINAVMFSWCWDLACTRGRQQSCRIHSTISGMPSRTG